MEGAKLAAIKQWTLDPCGPRVDGERGTREYFGNLVASRHAYAGWMDELYETAQAGRVLDIGCGQGIDLFGFARAEAASVTGVDLTPAHVSLATRHMASMAIDADIALGDAEALPFPDGSFDLVSSNGVLHHTPDTVQALREARRVLARGGLAQAVLYNKSSLHYWSHQVFYWGLIRGHLFRDGTMDNVLSRTVEYGTADARPLVKVYTPRQARELMKSAGFVEVRTRVRQLLWRDSFLAVPLKRFPGALDTIGHYVGWYVVVTGRKT